MAGFGVICLAPATTTPGERGQSFTCGCATDSSVSIGMCRVRRLRNAQVRRKVAVFCRLPRLSVHETIQRTCTGSSAAASTRNFVSLCGARISISGPDPGLSTRMVQMPSSGLEGSIRTRTLCAGPSLALASTRYQSVMVIVRSPPRLRSVLDESTRGQTSATWDWPYSSRRALISLRSMFRCSYGASKKA